MKGIIMNDILNTVFWSITIGAFVLMVIG